MTTPIETLQEQEQIVAEQATGCRGAGGYRLWAEVQGFPHCEVFDWTSSAGDWTFLVSHDGETWYPMFQENNWPRAGFTRTVDFDQPYCGTAEEVVQQMAAECG
jgi:hypothetical protein